MKLKRTIVFVFALITCTVGFAQLKTTPKCPDFDVDILDGTINKSILPTSTVGQIKLNLPCFTSFEDVGTTAECGAYVFYKDQDIYFYTDRDYVEIGPKFKGNLSLQLIGASRGGLFRVLGNPAIKDVNWDAFQTSYGILILYYNADSRINKIQFSTQSTANIKLCDGKKD